MIDDNDEILGGVIVEINDDNINHLDFLFVRVGVQSKGIGQAIWKEILKFGKLVLHILIKEIFTFM